MLDYRLEHIFSYLATLKPPEVIGPLAEGIRANFYVTGGHFQGPAMKGTMVAAGGDWLILRTDGVGVLDVRGTFQTDDGALIYTTYGGVLDLGEDGHGKFLRQELPPFVDLRIAPRYHTAHPKYLWLNRVQCVGIGRVDLTRMEVQYDVYAMR